MSNKGIELNLNIGLIQEKDMNLSVSTNLAYNQNRVTKLSLIEDTSSVGIQVGGIAGGIGNTVQIHSLNNSTFSYLLYEQLYKQNGLPIQVGELASIDVNNDGIIDDNDKWQTIHAFNDRDGDGMISPSDKYIINKPIPDLLIGGAINLNYKNWYSSISFRSEIGGYIYNNIHSNTATYQSVNGTQGFLSNISSLYYESEVQNISDYQLQSDYYLEKANFFRVDFFNVGYNVGDFLDNKIKNLDISISVQNLFLLTKYSGLDPEIGGGIDNNIYPRPRIFSLNLNFNF
jgi:iron complex outermembrane receptor protein